MNKINISQIKHILNNKIYPISWLNHTISFAELINCNTISSKYKIFIIYNYFNIASNLKIFIFITLKCSKLSHITSIFFVPTKTCDYLISVIKNSYVKNYIIKL